MTIFLKCGANTGAVLFAAMLTSCSVDHATDAANDLAVKARQFSLADLRPSKIDIVEVRESELRALPSGEERKMAYLRSPGRFGRFFGPVEFIEPDLPEGGFAADGMLLPSIE
jgi:hypothetical protein